MTKGQRLAEAISQQIRLHGLPKMSVDEFVNRMIQAQGDVSRVRDFLNDHFPKGPAMGATFHERGWDDREIRVSRKKLIETLKANRTKHIQEYKDACAGYKEAALAKIDQEMKVLKELVTTMKEKGDRFLTGISCGFSLPAPVSYEMAYDQAIEMMEYEVRDEVDLPASQFACFVRNDWDWMRQWQTSNKAYVESTRSKR